MGSCSSLLFDLDGLRKWGFDHTLTFLYDKSECAIHAVVTDYLPPVPCRGEDGPCSLRNGKGCSGLHKCSV